ncbi:hypothetical protein VTL71DRAFT_15735 [Oculimacula yallundae]|uniref:Zn(2)-C6 fungal-type domain-containing protein n=1 Tax=Oculimacula yallundae TaxID=86028 RepID=A0ABR4CER3_9HELO
MPSFTLTPTIEHDPPKEETSNLIDPLNISPSRSPSPSAPDPKPQPQKKRKAPAKKEPKEPKVPKNPKAPSRKRSASAAGFDANGEPIPPKPPMQRAAKACQNCRFRKVRCDVLKRERFDANGNSICTNCNQDNKPCIVLESHRRKKSGGELMDVQVRQTSHSESESRRSSQPFVDRRSSSNGPRQDDGKTHVPHPLYQNAAAKKTGNQFSVPPQRLSKYILPRHVLPPNIKPLRTSMTSIDIDFLYVKGALTIPTPEAESALLQAYCEFVHPYLPVLELHRVVELINDRSGQAGQISLLLYQAIMFAGSSFVDMHHLSPNYTSRRAAKRAFFQKARVLYDNDYEGDRVAIIQSVLLMTYWYGGPEDLKDTWHWMGIAISLAHTLGQHRDPANANMSPARKKLWKRIWWSCYMRDRLIALAMRRPTRITESDSDVPMLVEEDFEIAVLSDDMTVIPETCTLMRDIEVQRNLALMCIEKAKLCLCISHVLSVQYSVLVRHQGMQGSESSDHHSLMLVPKKNDEKDEVDRCDEELQEWRDNLPEACKPSENYTDTNAGKTTFVHRSILHMVYQSAVSALHRPQVLPNPRTGKPQTAASRQVRDHSYSKVCEASREVTKICEMITKHDLVKYLPTTGVTVLTPAIIICLLDIKSHNLEARQAAMDNFCKCMQVLQKLRDNYAAADRATQFLEAALRQTDLEIAMPNSRRYIGSQGAEVLNMQQIREAAARVKKQQVSPPRDFEETVADDMQDEVPMVDTPVEHSQGVQGPNTPESDSNPALAIPAPANDFAIPDFDAPGGMSNAHDQTHYEFNDYVNMGADVDGLFSSQEGDAYGGSHDLFGNPGWMGMSGNGENFPFNSFSAGTINPSVVMSGGGG